MSVQSFICLSRPRGFSPFVGFLHLGPKLLHASNRSYSASSPTPSVRILEVGPRDGLQNINKTISTATKIDLIRRLSETGLTNIEATSFVSPKWIPQLADGAAVMSGIAPLAQGNAIRFPVLAPNMKGLENAIKAGAKEVVVFASITEPFSRKNQNCTVDEALALAEAVVERARQSNILCRGATSCIFADPYDGPTDPQKVLRVVQRFLDMGCYEVALGDTLGVGTAYDTNKLLETLLKHVPAEKLAGHFHDTYGQAVANVLQSYKMGIRTFDSSVAGLGGCPYAKGAKGNLATEDLVYTLENSGISTGIDLDKLVETGEWISRQLGVPNSSRVGCALWAKAQQSQKSSPAEIPSLPSTATQSSRAWLLVEETAHYRATQCESTLKITLTRASKGNALTDDMLDDLTKLFRDLPQNSSVFHVVLESEGKFFCTGMDLSGSTKLFDKSDESRYYQKVFDLYEAIDRVPQTTIAKISGPCYGGGVGLGFVCDVRLVSPEARWTMSEVKIGVTPAIISKFMVREWGPSFAREAMISGREVRPEELERIGAIHTLSENTAALDIAMDSYLDRLEACAPRSAATCKDLVRLAWMNAGGQEQALKIEKTFAAMLAPASEGEFGIGQFQKKVRKVNWRQFWMSTNSKPFADA